MKNSCEQILVNKFYVCYKPFRHVETLFVQDRNLNLAGLQLVIAGFIYFPPNNSRPAWYKVSTLDE